MPTDRTSQANLLRLIDHTELRPSATYADIRRVCLEARHYGFGAVVVHPVHCARAAKHLRGSDVGLIAAVAFPTGAFTVEGKVFEARDAILHGATEIDYVVHIGSLLSGNQVLVLEEMEALREVTRGHILKATLETCVLTNEQKRLACKLAVDAKIDFVGTSTGFATASATVEDVRLMKDALGEHAGVNASGGIRTLRQARALLHAGASRLGTSAGVLIADDPTRGPSWEGQT